MTSGYSKTTVEWLADDPAEMTSAAPWTRYTQPQRWVFLVVLFLISTSNYFDRHLISVLLEPIKHEFHVSDTMLGVLSGFSFALFYSLFGVPIARWADSGNRPTIITVALAVWSITTALCGLAQTFWQLALARLGVGAGEAGAVPTGQSLLVDYFPPGRRAMALAVFSAASTAGYLLSFGVGGFVAANYGWRDAFLMAGLPGILLALITWATLDEPREHGVRQFAHGEHESVRENILALWKKRSFIHGLLGCLFLLLLAYGGLIFIPSFLVRVLHVPLATASGTYGLVAAAGSVIGTLIGGWSADRLAKRDIRWLAWLPGTACAVTGPLFMMAFATRTLWPFMSLAFIANLVMVGGMPIAWAAIHAVCGSQRRAMAVAIVLFVTTLVSGGFGPLMAGAISDALSARYGAEGLGYSLIIMSALLLPAALFFFAFGRTMSRDIED